MNDAMVGLQRTRTSYRMESEREKAIAIALDEARAGDIVLLAGKGHETSQVLKDRTLDLTIAKWRAVCFMIVDIWRSRNRLAKRILSRR